MVTVDLNCDLGEGYPHDAELMRYITSANIACGFHAGDESTMLTTAWLAQDQDVAIGAHPGYRDLEGFGRHPMNLPPREVHRIVLEQIRRLKGICDDIGAALHHVKPHGALYNQAAKDSELAAAIAAAVVEADPDLVLYGLAGSRLIAEAESAGLRTASEVFADRTYQGDGSLTPRTRSDALITDDEIAVAQAKQMIGSGTVRATTGEIVGIKADTICLHGDGVNAVGMARRIRTALETDGIQIRAIPND